MGRIEGDFDPPFAVVAAAHSILHRWAGRPR
jgi:hypothetical protein